MLPEDHVERVGDPTTAQQAPPGRPEDGARRSAALVTAGIVLSRLVGLVRQRVSAHYFGTSAFADVIAAAFRIGNVVQNLLGEGTLSASFIPVYAKLRAAGRDDEAARFAQSALGLLIAAVLVLSGLGVALAPWVTLLVAPGFEPDKLAVTARLVRIVFPMTGLLVLCAWALGVLNAHRRFFLPYAAPVIWSAAQIAALLVAGSWLGQQGEPLAQALSWGALAGAGVELALLMERARPLVGAIRPRLTLADEWLREAIRRLPGALLGRGVIQLSGLIDTLLVSFLGTGANATFAYAQMLYLLPMSLLGTGEAAASLPEMAGYSADADTERRNALLRRRLGAGLSRTAVLAVPTMVALILLGRETIALLLQTGKFDRSSTERVAAVLAIYGFALLANASGRLFATASFALGDTRGPGRYALVRMVASTAVALALMQPLGVVGVVVGAMSAGWLEAVLLGRRTRRALGGLGLAQVRFGRLGALAAVNAAVPLGVRWLLGWGLGEGFASSPGGSALVLAALAASFAVAAPALGLFELRSLIGRGR